MFADIIAGSVCGHSHEFRWISKSFPKSYLNGGGTDVERGKKGLWIKEKRAQTRDKTAVNIKLGMFT